MNLNHPTFAKWLGAALMVAIAALGVGIDLAAAGDPQIEQRIAALEAGQKAILKELQEIKMLLQARPPVPAPAAGAPAAPPNAVPPNLMGLPNFDMEIAGAATRGRADAKLVLLEFSDFQCPFCGRYSRETLSQIEHDYVDTGKLRYVFRHYPIEKLHPLALRASEAAECAGAQGKFWEMHTRLFANQQALGEAELFAHAQALGLGTAPFQLCMASQSRSPTKIRQDQAEGARAAITGTPTFFLGAITKEGKVKVARRLVGAAPYANFKSAIDALLAAPAQP